MRLNISNLDVNHNFNTDDPMLTAIEFLKDTAYWLSTHNKNYTKTQYYKIVDMLDVLSAIEFD